MDKRVYVQVPFRNEHGEDKRSFSITFPGRVDAFDMDAMIDLQMDPDSGPSSFDVSENVYSNLMYRLMYSLSYMADPHLKRYTGLTQKDCTRTMRMEIKESFENPRFRTTIEKPTVMACSPCNRVMGIHSPQFEKHRATTPKTVNCINAFETFTAEMESFVGRIAIARRPCSKMKFQDALKTLVLSDVFVDCAVAQNRLAFGFVLPGFSSFEDPTISPRRVVDSFDDIFGIVEEDCNVPQIEASRVRVERLLSRFVKKGDDRIIAEYKKTTTMDTAHVLNKSVVNADVAIELFRLCDSVNGSIRSSRNRTLSDGACNFALCVNRCLIFAQDAFMATMLHNTETTIFTREHDYILDTMTNDNLLNSYELLNQALFAGTPSRLNRQSPGAFTNIPRGVLDEQHTPFYDAEDAIYLLSNHRNNTMEKTYYDRLCEDFMASRSATSSDVTHLNATFFLDSIEKNCSTSCVHAGMHMRLCTCDIGEAFMHTRDAVVSISTMEYNDFWGSADASYRQLDNKGMSHEVLMTMFYKSLASYTHASIYETARNFIMASVGVMETAQGARSYTGQFSLALMVILESQMRRLVRLCATVFVSATKARDMMTPFLEKNMLQALDPSDRAQILKHSHDAYLSMWTSLYYLSSSFLRKIHQRMEDRVVFMAPLISLRPEKRNRYGICDCCTLVPTARVYELMGCTAADNLPKRAKTSTLDETGRLVCREIVPEDEDEEEGRYPGTQHDRFTRAFDSISFHSRQDIRDRAECTTHRSQRQFQVFLSHGKYSGATFMHTHEAAAANSYTILMSSLLETFRTVSKDFVMASPAQVMDACSAIYATARPEVFLRPLQRSQNSSFCDNEPVFEDFPETPPFLMIPSDEDRLDPPFSSEMEHILDTNPFSPPSEHVYDGTLPEDITLGL